MMTKQQVCNFLQISERTLDRYIKQGGLPIAERDGEKKNSKIYFHETEVQKLKDVLDHKRDTQYLRDMVLDKENFPHWGDDGEDIGYKPELSILGATNPNIFKRVVEKEKLKALEKERLKILKLDIIKLLPEIKEHIKDIIKDMPIQLSVKSFLTPKEAALLSGIAIKDVQQAISDGKLKVVRIGSRLRIKREDLDSYIKSFS